MAFVCCNANRTLSTRNTTEWWGLRVSMRLIASRATRVLPVPGKKYNSRLQSLASTWQKIQQKITESCWSLKKKQQYGLQSWTVAHRIQHISFTNHGPIKMLPPRYFIVTFSQNTAGWVKGQCNTVIHNYAQMSDIKSNPWHLHATDEYSHIDTLSGKFD